MKLLLNPWHILALVGMIVFLGLAAFSQSLIKVGDPDPAAVWAVRLAVAYGLG